MYSFLLKPSLVFALLPTQLHAADIISTSFSHEHLHFGITQRLTAFALLIVPS